MAASRPCHQHCHPVSCGFPLPGMMDEDGGRPCPSVWDSQKHMSIPRCHSNELRPGSLYLSLLIEPGRWLWAHRKSEHKCQILTHAVSALGPPVQIVWVSLSLLVSLRYEAFISIQFICIDFFLPILGSDPQRGRHGGNIHMLMVIVSTGQESCISNKAWVVLLWPVMGLVDGTPSTVTREDRSAMTNQ